MKNIRNFIQTTLIVSSLLLFSSFVKAQTPSEWEKLKDDINVFMINDMGRNGYYDQKPIAELMGKIGETIGPKCIIAAGDIHHFNGVASVQDPLWMTNFEMIYSHPELMIDWFPVLGNHEYRGNTQAVLDYGKISRRWVMPARYYSKVLSSSNTTLRILFLDTTPLINRYRNEGEVYPDASKQDRQKELDWIDETLKNAKEDWVICVGHHPIYADTGKDKEERTDMEKYLLPVLHKYGNVAIYACGHIHNFQHIKKTADNIDYLVNSSASLSRKKVSKIEGTVFCSNDDGFSIIAASKNELKMYIINNRGEVIHTITKSK